MAKKIGQLNVIDTITENDLPDLIPLISNKLIYSLGIYALPGTQFSINNSDSYFTIGGSGIFQIECEEHPIQSLGIKRQSLENTKKANHSIIIDYIYQEYEGGQN